MNKIDKIRLFSIMCSGAITFMFCGILYICVTNPSMITHLFTTHEDDMINILFLLVACGISNIALFLIFMMIKKEYHVNINDKLIDIDRLEVLTTISGSAAHEFRNVLSVISGYTEVMLLNVKKNDNVERLETIQQMCDRGLLLVKQLKRPDESEFNSITSITDVLNNTVSIIKVIHKNLEIDCWFNISSSRSQLNIQYLDQILLNILINASQAVTVNGGNVFVEYFENKTEHIIAVHDTGIGIKDSQLKDIFKLFYSTKGENGSGIGLAVTLNLVKQLKGTIDVENKDWTTFTIHIPK